MREEIKEIYIWLDGYSCSQNGKVKDRLEHASGLLRTVYYRTCCHGVIGCNGGSTCTSDHK